MLQPESARLPRRVAGCRYIYELLDPRTGESRYVGLTADPAERLWSHRSSSGHGSKALRAWREGLTLAGHEVEMRILAGPIPDASAKRAERHWIERRVVAGHALLNTRPGGSLGAMEVTWTRAVCEQRIVEFIDETGLARYPTARELIANGLSTACKVLGSCDGHAALAQRLSLPRAQRDWSDDADLDGALRDLAAGVGIGAYPSQDEFYAHGLGGAYTAVARRDGGHAAYAERLDLKRKVNSWTENELVEVVLGLIERLELDRYPSIREFHMNGHYGAAQAIGQRWGGHQRFSQLVGYPRTTAKPHRGPDDLQEAVRTLVEKLALSRYPTQREFNEHGLGGVYQAIDRIDCGHAGVSRTLGLKRFTSKGRWNEREARYAVVKALAERLGIDRYPTRREFLEAGLNGAYQAIGKHPGGHEACARTLGLRRLRAVPHTEEGLMQSVLSLIGLLGLDHYPSQSEFNENQLSGVESAIRKGVGHAAFAQKLGLARAGVAGWRGRGAYVASAGWPEKRVVALMTQCPLPGLHGAPRPATS